MQDHSHTEDIHAHIVEWLCCCIIHYDLRSDVPWGSTFGEDDDRVTLERSQPIIHQFQANIYFPLKSIVYVLGLDIPMHDVLRSEIIQS